MRKLLLLTLLTISSTQCFAQGVSHTNIVLVNSGLNARVVPSAVITVCAANNTNIPCSPALANTLFKDFLLSVPIANPFNADANGNYAFMAAPGNYTVSITGAGITGYSYQISLIGPSVGTANVWTQLQTFNLGITSLGPNTLSGGLALTGAMTISGGTITRTDAANFIISAAAAQDVGFVATGGGSIRLTNLDFISGATGRLTQYQGVNTVSGGFPVDLATVDLTAQGASIGVNTLYAVPSTGAGFYRMSCYAVVTQAATTSSTLPNCFVTWTDNDTSVVNTASLTATNTANTVGTVGFMSIAANSIVNFNAKASTNIQYSTANYASVGGTSMQYALHIRLEYIGP